MFKAFLLSFLLIVCALPTSGNAAKVSYNCPSEFHGIALPNASKQCRVFGVKKPSTLSLFVLDTPENIFLTFEEQLDNPKSYQHEKILSLVDEQGDFRVYVFKDGQGTQVNIRAE